MVKHKLDRCLEKPFDIKEPQLFDTDDDATFF